MRKNRAPAEPSADTSVELDAEKLIGGGRALAHHDGATWMIAGALPGERIRAMATKRRAGIVEARTLEVVDAGHPARSSDPCPHSQICGGCDWPHVEPTGGAELKKAAAAEAARAFPALATMIAAAPIRISPGGYRLRARLHWDPANGRLGFYGHRSRTVAAIDQCRILTNRCMRAMPTLISALADRCPESVDVEWLEGNGSARPVAALRPAKGGVAELQADWIPEEKELGSSIAGFHVLSRSGHLVTGWGAANVQMELPITLEVPIGSFFQGNRHLISPLFDRVAELIGRDSSPVFDLHAGVGFLAAAARHAGERKLTLVEPNRHAARAAQRNLPGSTVRVGTTAEAFVAEDPFPTRQSIVITDPPRAGLSKALRGALVDWRPTKILMLGCDPATWARDAGHLTDCGYTLRHIELFDLFPSTHHVEILALLEST